MELMDLGGGYHKAVNTSNWLDQKHSSFTSPNRSENTKWETTAMYMSVAEDDIRKAAGRVNAPIECWGCTKYPHIP